MNKKWFIFLILWQIIGIIVSLIITIPMGNFHHFIDYLTLCLSFTNFVALLGSIYFLFYKKWMKHKIKNLIIRIIISIFISALIIAASIEFASNLIKWICGLDNYIVDRWHLLIIAVNLIVLAAITLSLILFFLYQKLADNLEIKIKENEKLKRLQLESKLSLLQSKINPHFLFNTLNTILDTVRRDTAQVEKMVLNLSHIYRKTLTMPDNSCHALGEELQLVEEYLEIEKLRMGDRLQYEIKTDKKLNTYQIPPMIIQIVVENAIFHGLSPKKEGGLVTIQTYKNKDRILIDVIDSGVGIDLKKAKSGHGLYNIQQRLKLNYSDSAKFNISNQESGGTYISMELPYDS